MTGFKGEKEGKGLEHPLRKCIDGGGGDEAKECRF